MTLHLTEAMILSVRDGEPVAEDALAHLDGCASCARALEEARARGGTIEDALAALTVPAQAPDEAAAAERPPVGPDGTGGPADGGGERSPGGPRGSPYPVVARAGGSAPTHRRGRARRASRAVRRLDPADFLRASAAGGATGSDGGTAGAGRRADGGPERTGGRPAGIGPGRAPSSMSAAQPAGRSECWPRPGASSPTATGKCAPVSRRGP